MTIDLGLWEQILCTLYIALGLIVAGVCITVGFYGNSKISVLSIALWGGGILVVVLLLRELVNTWSMPVFISLLEKVVLLPIVIFGILCGCLLGLLSFSEGKSAFFTFGAFGGFTTLFLIWILAKLWFPDQAGLVSSGTAGLEQIPWPSILSTAFVFACGFAASQIYHGLHSKA